MRLVITETNFTTKFNWLFKLSDELGNDFYIMNDVFYKNEELKSPVTKKELDFFDKGHWINALVKEINGERIVLSFK